MARGRVDVGERERVCVCVPLKVSLLKYPLITTMRSVNLSSESELSVALTQEQQERRGDSTDEMEQL